MSDSSPQIESKADLLAYFHASETPRAEWRVGTEHEKVGIYADTWERVPYEGERGIGALLARIQQTDGWKPVYEGESVIGLLKDGASITLEPGGQIELSGAPLASARETCREFSAHVELLKRHSEDFNIAWLGLGLDPIHPVSEIPVMPKHRYEIMRSYLPTRGALALEMMHATATVQANYDYADEPDMVSKLRMAMGVTAIVSALFANSPLGAGSENGYVSRRVAIWRDTDPDRCGVLPFVFDSDFGYERYADWALDVPLFFIIRDGRYIQPDGLTFRGFMERGLEGHRPTVKDWDTHLTTLFPEVRLKRIIEVRGADVVPRELICALPALWKGLLYDEDACEAAWQMVSDIAIEERHAAQLEVARRGLAATIDGRPALELARELVGISAAGLDRLVARGETASDEGEFLEPLFAQLELGKSPGEVVLERWRGEWQGSMERLIEYARY